MTAATPAAARRVRSMWPRLVLLHVASRRGPVALAVMAGCAAVLWAALHRQWNAYGAVQLPLLFVAPLASVTTRTCETSSS